MTPRDTRDEVIALLEQTERHCPCGARPESPQTHPHVIGCPLEKALVMLRDQGVADDELGMQFLSQRLRIAELEALLRAPETPQHEWVGPSMHESTCRKCGISHAEFRAGVADRCLFRAPETQERGWQDERARVTALIESLPSFDHAFYGVCVNRTAALLALGSVPPPAQTEDR